MLQPGLGKFLKILTSVQGFYWEISNVLFSFACLSFFPFYIVVDHRLRFCVTLFRMIWEVLFLSTLKHFHIYERPPTSLIIDSLPLGPRNGGLCEAGSEMGESQL